METSTNKVINYAVNKPKSVMALLIMATVIAIFFLPRIAIDTDPENMLSHSEPVRVFHDNMKKQFSLYDIIVLGIVNEKHPNGVFNPTSLKNIDKLTKYIKTLKFKKSDNDADFEGVVESDLLSLSTVDNIKQAGPGTVQFEWMMQNPPTTQEGADQIQKAAKKIPFLDGTLVSEDQKAACIYIPITSKNISYKIATLLRKKFKTLDGDDEYHIAGLPVAEDTFGTEMFKQMAISAPLAMLVIFILLFVFFKKIKLIISPMIIAMCSVIVTMGLLIGTGFTVHIMSSMIPIFIMPIAVLDSIHIVSEFFELYQKYRDRKKTILLVMQDLFMPMLYTSLTSAAGFASLMLTPIPPVQVFGGFIAFGVMFAWLLTITVIPAYIMLMPESSLKDFGHAHHDSTEPVTMLAKFLNLVNKTVTSHYRFIISLTAIAAIAAAIGINLITINDNPTRWFVKEHPIRVADKVLNHHFGGTYMGYLAFESNDTQSISTVTDSFKNLSSNRLLKMQEEDFKTDAVKTALFNKLSDIKNSVATKEDFVKEMQTFVEGNLDNASDDDFYIWEEVLNIISEVNQNDQIFKDPRLLAYIETMQKNLKNKTEVVGKSNSITDIVKTVYRELMEGKEEFFTVPDTRQAVAQCLITYQNSHRPQDLWHMISPDYKKANIWIQLKSGDNKDMVKVVKFVDEYIRKNPPPVKIKHAWFGLTYINVLWQDKMVSGMLTAFLGSFLVVFVMMAYLFRSALWGILAMIPLSVTIAFIYGAVGFIGKDYDMPIAVLSSLTLGLAVDFAIHFLARTRELHKENGSWEVTSQKMFTEPARAISRNVIVIAVGFLPLLAAPLLPYKTVGIFLATILMISGIATLIILPALVSLLKEKLFADISETKKITCSCVTCGIIFFCSVILTIVNFNAYIPKGIEIRILLIGIGFIASMAACCLFRKRFCKTK